MLGRVQPSPAPRAVQPSMGCGYAVCVALVVGGLALLANADTKWRAGRTNAAWLTGGFGAALCLVGAGLVVPMQREVARSRARLAREEARPKEPWTWDPGWTGASGIVQSGRRHGRALMLIGWAFLAAGAAIGFTVLPRELDRGNRAGLVALVFPLLGSALVFTALRDAWRRRKYGVAHFVPAALPIPLGGELRGRVIVDRPVNAAGPGRAALDCWCTKQSGSDGETRETATAHTEREIAPGDWTHPAGRSQLFVQLPLRGGAATTMRPIATDRPVFEWRLRVEVPTPGADFVAEFVLPVFDVADPAAAALVAPPATAAQTDRAAVWRAAGVREEPEPRAIGGRALVLPARMGREAVGTPLVVTLGLAAIGFVLWWSQAPIWVLVGVGLFNALMATVVVALWRGGGERLWVESDAVCVAGPKGVVRRVPVAELQKLESNTAVGVGTLQFHRIAARLRPAKPGFIGKRINLASQVRGEEAATLIVTWLEERLAETTGA